ncbi:hypothetical protein H0H92_005563 [Tricholoma furcatifolium]|nr:hypothetical protein H0H92_005563 [Tricholoma furcatifolium]
MSNEVQDANFRPISLSVGEIYTYHPWVLQLQQTCQDAVLLLQRRPITLDTTFTNFDYTGFTNYTDGWTTVLHLCILPDRAAQGLGSAPAPIQLVWPRKDSNRLTVIVAIPGSPIVIETGIRSRDASVMVNSPCLGSFARPEVGAFGPTEEAETQLASRAGEPGVAMPVQAPPRAVGEWDAFTAVDGVDEAQVG